MYGGEERYWEQGPSHGSNQYPQDPNQWPAAYPEMPTYQAPYIPEQTTGWAIGPDGYLYPTSQMPAIPPEAAHRPRPVETRPNNPNRRLIAGLSAVAIAALGFLGYQNREAIGNYLSDDSEKLKPAFSNGAPYIGTPAPASSETESPKPTPTSTESSKPAPETTTPARPTVTVTKRTRPTHIPTVTTTETKRVTITPRS